MDGDVYLLRLILHDWTDADSIVILSNIRAAIGTAKARLVIAEVLPSIKTDKCLQRTSFVQA